MAAAKKTKPKKTKAKKVAKASKVKAVSKKVAKVAKKAVKAEPKVKVSPAQAQKNKKIEDAVKRLIHKGKERGFVTHDEILKEFPTVEDDVEFIGDLYSRLSTAGIDILESGGLLDVSVDDTLKKYTGHESSSGYDSIPMQHQHRLRIALAFVDKMYA